MNDLIKLKTTLQFHISNIPYLGLSRFLFYNVHANAYTGEPHSTELSCQLFRKVSSLLTTTNLPLSD